MIFIGKVGISRVGEMFSSQISDSFKADDEWTLTPYSSSGINKINNYNSVSSTESSTDYSTLKKAVRPIITLRSTIKITGGSGYVGGNVSNPYEIGN